MSAVATGCTVLAIPATSTAVARPVPVEPSNSAAGPDALGPHLAASPLGTSRAVLHGSDGTFMNQPGVLVNWGKGVGAFVNPTFDLGGSSIDPNDRASSRCGRPLQGPGAALVSWACDHADR